MNNNSNTLSRFRPVEIGNIDGKRAVVEAVPQAMTAFGGAAMLQVIEKKVGLVKELCSRISDKRNPKYIEHQATDIVMQRVCQTALGFAGGSDSDWLHSDPGILMGLGRNPESANKGASQPTISRFESQAINKDNWNSVTSIFIDHYITHHKKKRKKKHSITIDADGVKYITYGSQQGSVYRGGDKYGCQMYFPLQFWSGDWLLGTILRKGYESEAPTILPELKKIVKKLRDHWPRIRIKVRMDCAFASPALVEWLKRQRIRYELGLKNTSVIKLYSKAFVEEAERMFKEQHGKPRFLNKNGKFGKKEKDKLNEEHKRIRDLPAKERLEQEREWNSRRVRVVGEFCYKPEKWKSFLKWEEWERVICRVDYTDKGADVRCIITSQQYGFPQKVYEDDYATRGAAEQCIGVGKQVSHRLSAQEFNSNQFRLILNGISQMLLMHLRNYVACSLRRADVNTMRKKVLLMPMIVRQTDKKIVLQISENHQHCKEFLATWRRLSTA